MFMLKWTNRLAAVGLFLCIFSCVFANGLNFRDIGFGAGFLILFSMSSVVHQIESAR